MKLIGLTLPAEKPKALRLQREIDLRRPTDDVLGWRVLIRGPAVILLAPPGSPEYVQGGHEIARSECKLRWDGESPSDYDSLTTLKYTSEPLSRVDPTTPAEMTDEDLERATAPVPKSKSA